MIFPVKRHLFAIAALFALVHAGDEGLNIVEKEDKVSEVKARPAEPQVQPWIMGDPVRPPEALAVIPSRDGEHPPPYWDREREREHRKPHHHHHHDHDHPTPYLVNWLLDAMGVHPPLARGPPRGRFPPVLKDDRRFADFKLRKFAPVGRPDLAGNGENTNPGFRIGLAGAAAIKHDNPDLIEKPYGPYTPYEPYAYPEPMHESGDRGHGHHHHKGHKESKGCRFHRFAHRHPYLFLSVIFAKFAIVMLCIGGLLFHIQHRLMRQRERRERREESLYPEEKADLLPSYVHQ